MKDGDAMVEDPCTHSRTAEDNGDPLVTLMRARQLIHDAQSAIEEVSKSVVQQRSASAEIPERHLVKLLQCGVGCL